MPMPIASCAAEVTSDVCCDSWYLMGERIRSVCTLALADCLADDPECADREFRSYQTEGELQDLLGDHLVVVFQGADIRVDSRRPGSGNTISAPITRAYFRIELIENGWPNAHIEGTAIVSPDWEMQHALSRHARGHAERIWRAMIAAVAAMGGNQSKALFPMITNSHILRNGVGVGRINPRPRPGPQIGYFFDLTVDHTLP